MGRDLDVDDVEVDDHFIEIGGNSLLALEVVAAVNGSTGVAVPLGEFFANPTPRALAAVVADRAVSR